MSAVEDTYGKKNWVIRIVDLLFLCDRTYRRFNDSMIGRWLLDLHRARKERKKSRSTYEP